MSSLQNGNSRQLFEQYVKLLGAEGIDFETNEARTALMLYGETVAGPCEGFIVIEALEAADMDAEVPTSVLLDFCEVAYVLPLESLPDDGHPGLFELIVRLNEGHRIGAYELHTEEKELRFRIYQTLPAQHLLAREHLLMPLYEGIRAINSHWLAFHMVLEEDLDPTHALGEVYAVEALEDKEGPDEELLERANVLFNLARARYEARGRDELLVALDERLRRLTVEAGNAFAKGMG